MKEITLTFHVIPLTNWLPFTTYFSSCEHNNSYSYWKTYTHEPVFFSTLNTAKSCYHTFWYKWYKGLYVITSKILLYFCVLIICFVKMIKSTLHVEFKIVKVRMVKCVKNFFQKLWWSLVLELFISKQLLISGFIFLLKTGGM